MALTKQDEETLKKILKELIPAKKYHNNDKYKQTEKRLYAYPILKRNIERYKLDIEDIKCEDMRKSKDFVLFLKNSGGSEQVDIEALRAGKTLLIKQKMARDEKEVNEIEKALKEIRNDEYYDVIELTYFKKIDQIKMIQQLHCDRSTAWRNRKRLINALSVTLYGADAL